MADVDFEELICQNIKAPWNPPNPQRHKHTYSFKPLAETVAQEEVDDLFLSSDNQLPEGWDKSF